MIRLLNLQLRNISTPQKLYRFAKIRFPLPDLGEKIKEGRVKKLYVKEGDKIKEFSKIADVESDKQFTEITSPEEGIIKKIFYHEDTVCQVGDVFLEIETNSDSSKQSTVETSRSSQHSQFVPISQPSIQEDDYLASATVKMWAREHKIDLKQVKGTGKKNRILKQDIIYYLENKNNKQIKGKVIQQSVSTAQPINAEVVKVKMNENEKQMYKLASYSKNIPYLYFHQSIDIGVLVEITESLKQKNKKISILSLLIKTLSLAINQYPRVNSIYDIKNPFSFKQSQNQNLLLPNYGTNSFFLIKNLEILSILNLQKQLDTQNSYDLQRSKENIRSATITLSNIGQIGGRSINPVIYGQTVTHAGLGCPYQKVFFSNGKIFKKNLIDISVAGDHRVLDGASVAKWTMAWKEISQNPRLAFLSMI